MISPARLLAIGVGTYVATVVTIWKGSYWYYARKWPMYAPAKEEKR